MIPHNQTDTLQDMSPLLILVSPSSAFNTIIVPITFTNNLTDTQVLFGILEMTKMFTEAHVCKSFIELHCSNKTNNKQMFCLLFLHG